MFSEVSHCISGTSCPKLTMLVNDLLKFQMAILQIQFNTLLFFVEKKCENPLQCKGFSHFYTTK